MKAAKKLNIIINIGSIITKKASDISYLYSELLELMEGIGHITSRCLPAGAAIKNIDSSDLFYAEDLLNSDLCCYNTNTLAVFPDGNVYSCCSQLGQNTQLCLGNVNDYSLEKIRKSYNSNIHIRILHKYGLKWYLDIANKIEYSMFNSDIYTGKCELCHKIFSDEDFMKMVSLYIEDYRQSIYQKYLQAIN
ncbi:MAG: SPASM domain-containing protein [Lachnotalea sp.]